MSVVKHQFWFKCDDFIWRFTSRPKYVCITDSSVEYFVVRQQCGLTHCCIHMAKLNGFIMLTAAWMSTTLHMNVNNTTHESQQHYTQMSTTLHINVNNTTHECQQHYTWMSKTLRMNVNNTTHECQQHYTWMSTTLHMNVNNTTHECQQHYTWNSLLRFHGNSIYANASRCYVMPTLPMLLTLRSLTLYIYGAPILDVSRSHTTTQHSR